MAVSMLTVLPGSIQAIAVLLLLGYVVVVRKLRFRRRDEIAALFKNRPLSSMTTQESFDIMKKLQELEFPYSFRKAQKIALLKAGGIPTQTKVFAVTGQNTPRNAVKRAVDTEILLREVRVNDRVSDRYTQAVARMNFLHSRWRKANKILDIDMLHTLGSGIIEAYNVIDHQEWRQFTAVEKCALGVWHMNLGEDMDISYHFLPSFETGWRDGLHFADELYDWTVKYESEAAVPHEKNDVYVNAYVHNQLRKLPKFAANAILSAIATEIHDPMRTALGLRAPGAIIEAIMATIKTSRKMYLRYFSLPRPSTHPSLFVDSNPNEHGLLNFSYLGPQPYYNPPTWWKRLISKRIGEQKYSPQGYNLKTIGPKPAEGHGSDEMKATMDLLKQSSLASCPFGARARETKV